MDICFGVKTCKLRFAQQGLVACMLLSITENWFSRSWFGVTVLLELSMHLGQHMFFVSQFVCEYLKSGATLCTASTCLQILITYTARMAHLNESNCRLSTYLYSLRLNQGLGMRLCKWGIWKHSSEASWCQVSPPKCLKCPTLIDYNRYFVPAIWPAGRVWWFSVRKDDLLEDPTCVIPCNGNVNVSI